MGVNGTANNLWSATGLTLKSLNDLNIGKRLDVDGNAILWQKLITKYKGEKHISHIIDEMARDLQLIAYSGGLIITVIFDGDVRPDCKRASLYRARKDRLLDDIARMKARTKVLLLSGIVRNRKHINESCIEEEAELKEYTSLTKVLESKCRNNLTIPEDVGQRLSEKLMEIDACTPNENGGYVQEAVLKAKFQADSVIAKRVIEDKADFIYSEDSNFVALLGNKAILLKSIDTSCIKKKYIKIKKDN